jgi:hypothetical protein
MTLLKKNTSKLDLGELLHYLNELHELIMEERTMALSAYEEVRASVAQMVAESGGDVDTIIHLLGNSPAMASQSKLAGEASARLVKLAEIKSKVLISILKNDAENSSEVLTEEAKNELLKEAEELDGKTGRAAS